MDEQIYPVEKSTDIELVATLSAFQIRWMLRVSDPEAMFDAARGYLRTAEKLDALADGIHRNSTDLAAAWHGAAAAESQEQLRQFYGSARSLATAARSSAIAVGHAAQALALARYRASTLPGSNLPSADPHSVQSWSYQAILADLNAAYRDAAGMAPDQIAVSLPTYAPIEQWSTDWMSTSRMDADSRPGPHVGYRGTGFTGSRLPELPSKVPSHLPSTDSTSSRDLVIDRSSRALVVPALYARNGDGDLGQLRSPYDVGSELAGGHGLSTIGSGVTGQDAHLSRLSTHFDVAAGGNNPNAGVGDKSRMMGAPAVGESGIYPSAPGSRQESERDRERRYYFKEEREVWGERYASPPVLYGEYQPPGLHEYDDDDF